MPTITRDQALKADDREKQLVHVPEWGGDVWVRTLTALERDSFELAAGQAMEEGQSKNIRAKLVALCAVDDHGDRIFSDADVGALGLKSSVPMDRIFSAAQRLNKLRNKDVEDVRKNSENGQAVSSP